MLRPRTIISSTRFWVPIILNPIRCMRNIIDCFSSYDETMWSTNLEKFDSGIKLAMEIFLPALLLGVVGSCLPTSILGDTVNLSSSSCMDILSPYTSHSAILSSSTALTSTPIIHQHSLLSNFDPIYLLRITILSLISPLSLDVIFNRLRPIVFQVLQRFKVVLQSRKRADHSTRVQLREKIKVGRVLQRHSYDLYLPPKESSGDATTDSKLFDNPIKCLLFFPGFGIHHSAYADVASLISQYGIPVAVVSLEPLRLAHAKLGGSIQDVQRILKYAGRDVVKYYKRNENNNLNEETVDERIILEWDFGGHSMGGYNSLQLAQVLQQSDDEQLTIKLSKKDDSISRIGSQIIVWGAGNLVDSVPNLQTSNSDAESSLRVLILLGSNDDLAKFTCHRQKRDLLRKLPRRSRMQTIKGANHSGFSSYDEASKKSSTFLLNGIRDITLKDQQKMTARRTADFLLNQ